MKKKLFGALLLSVLVLFSLFVMTSCKPDDEQKNNSGYVTLTMWVIWEGHDPQNNTAMKMEETVEKAFNDVTMESRSTKVVFNWCKDEAEYRTKIAAANANPAEITNNPTYGADGYPIVAANQLDLVLVLDKDMYVSFAENGHLVNLNTMLSTGSDKGIINELATYLEYTVTNGASGTGNYAVPNVSELGSYTYLLVHKEAATTFQFAESDFTDIASCLRLIEEIYAAKGSSNPAIPTSVKNLYPILDSFDYYNARFFTGYSDSSNADRNLFDFYTRGSNGLIATFWNAKTAHGAIGDKSLVNALNSDDYLSYLALMNWAEKNSVYPTDVAAAAENGEFAVAVMEGDYGLRNEYDDYYCIVLDPPRLSGEDFYNGMWGVSAYSSNPERALEIITDLETTKNGTAKNPLLNILVHGVKDEQYSYNPSTDTITSFGTYYVEPRYCGNIFHVYADETRGQDEGWYSELKKQGQDAKKDLWLDFDFIVGTYNIEELKWLPTCAKQGVVIYNCPVCNLGASYQYRDMKDHVDENGDKKCDSCLECLEHRDTNTDNECDNCGACVKLESEKLVESHDPAFVQDGECQICERLVDHTEHSYTKKSSEPVIAATCTLPALYAYTCECGEGGVKYRPSGARLGHEDADTDGNCDNCTLSMTLLDEEAQNGTHQDFYNEFALKNSAVSYAELCALQTASNEIFDILLQYSFGYAENSAEADALEGLGILDYARAFKEKAGALNTQYFDSQVGTHCDAWHTQIEYAQDVNTREPVVTTLAGNLRYWYVSLQPQ